jgi:serine/threonine protein kinase
MVYKEPTWFGFKMSSNPMWPEVFARKIFRVNRAIEEEVRVEAANLKILLRCGKHPHIINVFLYGWLKGVAKSYFMDMELADFSLCDYIKYFFQDVPLPNISIPSSPSAGVSPSNPSIFNRALSERNCSIKQRLQTIWTIGLHICNGLKFMHDSGLVHRDLKPQNGKFEGSFLS